MTRQYGRFICLVLLGLGFWTTPVAAMGAHGEEASPLFHVIRFQLDGTHNGQGALFNWEGSGWIGGDSEKLAFKTEGEMAKGHVEKSEVWGLYTRNVATFWDFQAGLRQDFDPRPESYLVAGVAGLAPYFFETEAHAFLSKRGDLSFRLEQSIDLLLTQRLILEPHFKVDFSASNVPEQHIGSGFSHVEAGAQFRYEISRKFAPYIDLVYERSLGNTARMARASGEDTGDFTIRAGLRFWF